MKKIITPIIYLVFLLLLTGISVAAEMIARSSGLLPEWNNMVDRPTLILGLSILIIFGIPIFWLANKLIKRIEKSASTNVYDHIRQSFFFYLMAIYSLSTWTYHGFTGNEADGYLLLWLGISIVAILTNGIFLRRH